MAVDMGVAREHRGTDWEVVITRLFLALPIFLVGLMLVVGLLVWVQTGEFPHRLYHLALGPLREKSLFVVGLVLLGAMFCYPIALLYALVVWSSDKDGVWRNTFLFGLSSPILALLSLNIPGVYQIVAWAMD